jgi:D-allose transport system substrate-binding protein
MDRRKNLFLVVLAVLMVMLALPVFSSGQAEADQEVVAPRGGEMSRFNPDEFGAIPTPSQVWRIGVMEKSLINDFWLDVKNGYEDAARDYGIDVEIFAAPSESDLLVQANTLEDMLAQGFDILCVSPITDTNLLAPLATATQLGIPIINSIDAHITPENQERHNIDIEAFITVDFSENTRLSVEYIAEQLGDEGGKVIHIMGIPGGAAAENRRDGHLAGVAANPQLEDVGVYNGDWDRRRALDVAADVLQAHPDLRGIVAANDNMAMGAYQAVLNAGMQDQVIVTGVDATPDGIASIQNGELGATTAFFQYALAYSSVEAAILILEGQFDGKPEVVYGPQEIWSSENISDKIEEYRDLYVGLQNMN